MHDSKAFRRSLGRFATGVTVITCADEEKRPYGITANSFSSVSLEPPLILWNIAKVSNSREAFLEAEHFAINVLGQHQEHLSQHFARTDHTQFDAVETARSEHGVPLIPDAIATFECRTHEIHDCGDHHIIIGEVEAFRADDEPPLVFFGGRYRELSAGD